MGELNDCKKDKNCGQDHCQGFWPSRGTEIKKIYMLVQEGFWGLQGPSEKMKLGLFLGVQVRGEDYESGQVIVRRGLENLWVWEWRPDEWTVLGEDFRTFDTHERLMNKFHMRASS